MRLASTSHRMLARGCGKDKANLSAGVTLVTARLLNAQLTVALAYWCKERNMTAPSGDLFAPENAGMLWALTFAFALVIFALWLFVQWRIFAKAGYPGALSLINLAVLIPVIGILIVFGLQIWFAFAHWPALKAANSSKTA
jgi:hypothetical protein